MNKGVKVSESTDDLIAGRQWFRCANSPGSNLYSLKGYLCPLWRIETDEKGRFDEAGYDIDYIGEFSLIDGDESHDLHAICKMCYGVKKNRLMLERARLKQIKREQSVENDSDY